MQYYINFNGANIGPMSAREVFNYPVNENTSVCGENGMWQPLYTYPELMGHLHEIRSRQAATADIEISNKKIICGILAILVGSLGVHYFVMGKVAGGFITILLSIVTCGLWSIVMLIQGIMILCMSNEDFKRKYLDSTSTLPLF